MTDAQIQALRTFQRHVLLREFGEDGHVLPENLEVSTAIDAVLAAAEPDFVKIGLAITSALSWQPSENGPSYRERRDEVEALIREALRPPAQAAASGLTDAEVARALDPALHEIERARQQGFAVGIEAARMHVASQHGDRWCAPDTWSGQGRRDALCVEIGALQPVASLTEGLASKPAGGLAEMRARDGEGMAFAPTQEEVDAVLAARREGR
jgi:hypothetical protein